MERKRPVFAKRPTQFPPRNPRSCAKNRNTLPPRLLSRPYHEIEVCRGKAVSDAKVTMGPFFDNRADIIWGTCTRTSCECWHPPECQFYKNETGCKAGDKCVFPHCKFEKQPNKNAKKSYFQKRRESDDKNAVANVKKCITIGLCITRFRCTRFSR